MKVEVPRNPENPVRRDLFIDELRAAGLTVEDAHAHRFKVVVEGEDLNQATIEQVLAAHNANALTPEEQAEADKKATQKAAVKGMRDKANPGMGDLILVIKILAEEWLVRNSDDE